MSNSNDSRRKFTNLFNILGPFLPDVETIDQLYEETLIQFDATNLEEIPQDIGLLINLEDLCIEGEDNPTEIIVVPSTIKDLIKLKSLTLSWHSIQKINVLPLNLTKVNLSGNKLENVPDCILVLQNLEELNLSNNLITNLPLFEKTLKLKELDVSHNQIRILPSFKHLNMFRLGLSSNKIEDIMDGTLPVDLTILELYNNKFKHIPNEIIRLEKLWFLDLRYNKIIKIPRTIKNMLGLKNFYVKGNKADVPTWAAKMANSKFISPDF